MAILLHTRIPHSIEKGYDLRVGQGCIIIYTLGVGLVDRRSYLYYTNRTGNTSRRSYDPATVEKGYWLRNISSFLFTNFLQKKNLAHYVLLKKIVVKQLTPTHSIIRTFLWPIMYLHARKIFEIFFV